MASKTKLELAVESRIAQLNGAQQELVRSQLAAYRRNIARISQIEDELSTLNARMVATRDEVRLKQLERSTLSYEHNQLLTANSKIAADLFDLLEE